MRPDLDEQLDRLGDWMEAETGERLRPDLSEMVVSSEEVAAGGRRRMVLVAAAALAFLVGGVAVVVFADRGSGPTAVITPQADVPERVPWTDTTEPPPTSTTAAAAATEVDEELVEHVAETFVERTLDGSESAWSVIVLDSTTGEQLASAGEEDLVVDPGSAIHIVPVAAAVAAGYGDGREIDGTGPCVGPDGEEIQNFGGGLGSVGTLRNHVTSARRCAMTRLDQELRPDWILGRAGLPRSDDLVGAAPRLDLADLAELTRALTGDGVHRTDEGSIRLVEPETAQIVRGYYEHNVVAGTGGNMEPSSGTVAAGVTGTNEDSVSSLSILRTDDVVIAAAIEDPDGANAGRNLTGGSFPAQLAAEVHGTVWRTASDLRLRPRIAGSIDPAVRPSLTECGRVRWGGGTGHHATADAAMRALFGDETLPLPREPYLQLLIDEDTIAYVPDATGVDPDVIIDVVRVDGRWSVERWEQADC